MTDMSNFQHFIALSKYARWLPKKGRRETWEETVDRYWTWITNKFPAVESRTDIRDAIFNLEVMPSMRLLMTAGDPVDRDNTCAFNCSYLPISDLRSFAEVMFILMNGTGVGYSVENQYVSQLPKVPTITKNLDRKIIVQDSKEGWADGLYELLRCLYSGVHPLWDMSCIRPAGSRLETFGGRASGPGPLHEVFKFVTNTMYKAQGRRLTSLECHDICCVIARSVIVGGVRRSAMISLSDLHDTDMATCKSGAWWDTQGHRSLANNSAVYENRPSLGQFLHEWTNLYESRSGERGIFNRSCTTENTLGRDLSYQFGTNPCGEILLRPYGLCNLSEVVIRSTDTEDDIIRKVEQATILGTLQSALTYFPFLRPEWTKNANEERLLGVSMTGIYDNEFMSSPSTYLESLLEHLTDVTRRTNREWSDKIGINPSVAITCVKPSGTVSCLVDSSSGIHPRFAPYYLRRARIDKKDPMYFFLKDQGVPCEDCVMNPSNTAVFTFKQKAPFVDSIYNTAIDHLELWMFYKKHWTDHNPSVTINYTDEEFMGLGAAVYNNFDLIGGVSFLPKVDHVYAQAPFEEISKEDYQSFPEVSIDWTQLSKYELEDSTTASHTMACTGGSCEIIDITMDN